MVIREDGSYEIGQVVGRAWSWFLRYGSDGCLVGKKSEEGYEEVPASAA